MRLTLRTLLAYLDNTLDKDAAESLRLKLTESGFATQLVQRIRSSLTNQTLSAPTFDAVNPIAEANVISEYLDSTLAGEQVAEIERICLESDMHLAEAAACHQILTMVLGKSADVPDELRNRIYELPDRGVQDIASATGSGAPVGSGIQTGGGVQTGSGVQTGGGVPESGSFASVNVPNEEVQPGVPDDDMIGAAIASAPAVSVSPAAPVAPVAPVGPADSGVSDAGKRIRDSGVMGGTGKAIPERGDREHLEKSDLYGGIRTSRITPWLVSAALVAVFLFSLARILDPLFNSVAQTDPDQQKMGELYPELTPNPDVESEEDIVVSAAEAPVMEPVGSPGVDIQPSESNVGADLPAPASPVASQPTDTLPAASSRAPMRDLPETPGELDLPNRDTASEETASGETASGDMTSQDMTSGDTTSGDMPSKEMANADMTSEEIAVPAIAGSKPMVDTPDANPFRVIQPATPEGGASLDGADSVLPAASSVAKSEIKADDATAMEPAPDAETEPSIGAASEADTAAVMEAENSDMSTKVPDAPTVEMLPETASALATLKSDDSLIFTNSTDGWLRLAKSSSVSQRSVLVNAPKFTATFSVGDSATVQVVDAAQFNFIPPEADSFSGIDVDFGRLLIKSLKAGVATEVRFGDKAFDILFSEADLTAAVEVRYARRAGFDPFTPKNHLLLARVVAVSGEVTVVSDDNSEILETGKQWMVRGADEVKISDMPSVPAWIDGSDDSPLDSSARSGLQLLLKQEQPVILSLQEATLFRKSEVAALAAQTMLFLGRGDVFFGSDGVLSQAKQRNYWPEHLAALRSVVNRSPDAANAIRANIGKMDSADGASLFRLLIGFSQNQLVEGGDEELLEMLNSSSMSVRVLAMENLREITGVTLSFRPEEENAIRRKAALKKWQARQRNGDIRWP